MQTSNSRHFLRHGDAVSRGRAGKAKRPASAWSKLTPAYDPSGIAGFLAAQVLMNFLGYIFVARKRKRMAPAEEGIGFLHLDERSEPCSSCCFERSPLGSALAETCNDMVLIAARYWRPVRDNPRAEALVGAGIGLQVRLSARSLGKEVMSCRRERRPDAEKLRPPRFVSHMARRLR